MVGEAFQGIYIETMRIDQMGKGKQKKNHRKYPWGCTIVQGGKSDTWMVTSHIQLSIFCQGILVGGEDTQGIHMDTMGLDQVGP